MAEDQDSSHSSDNDGDSMQSPWWSAFDDVDLGLQDYITGLEAKEPGSDPDSATSTGAESERDDRPDESQPDDERIGDDGADAGQLYELQSDEFQPGIDQPGKPLSDAGQIDNGQLGEPLPDDAGPVATPDGAEDDVTEPEREESADDAAGTAEPRDLSSDDNDEAESPETEPSADGAGENADSDVTPADLAAAPAEDSPERPTVSDDIPTDDTPTDDIPTDDDPADGAEVEATAPESSDGGEGDARSLWRRLLKPAPCTVLWHKIGLELLHIALFIVVSVGAVCMLQASLYPDEEFVFNPRASSAAAFVWPLWNDSKVPNPASDILVAGAHMAFVNLFALAVIYSLLILVTNRFWVGTWIFESLTIVYYVANSIKISEREEPVIPSDLNFISGGNTGNLMQFVTDEQWELIHWAILTISLSFVVMLVTNHFDCRRSFIAPRAHKRIAAAVRCIIICGYLIFMGAFVNAMSVDGSWACKQLDKYGDTPVLWSSIIDSQHNGTIVAFVRLVHTEVMEKPDGYSEQAMQDIAERYSAAAQDINATRSENLNDSTVIVILSESYTDPTRIPGTSFDVDPVPYLHQVKSQTTSGLMLSSGYGGGTANMEYMSLTGLDTLNFSPSMSSPYQQLVPNESWTPSFNQLWNGGADSYGFHPFQSAMYSRSTVYKKFGFSYLYALDSEIPIEPQDTLPNSPYVSDQSAYTSVLNEVQSADSPEFISLMTMQNHAPDNWAYDPQFQPYETTRGSLGQDDYTAIADYATQLNYTDQALQEFLTKLDAIDKPITVIWYGDHYPGILSDTVTTDANALALHETDYFIWSNAASGSAGTKLPDSDTAYTSPNYFMAQTAEHMNAKVSPYLAFLTKLHEKVPALSIQLRWNYWAHSSDTGGEYLNAQGEEMNPDDFDEETRRMLEDYKLIQYDITAGKGYLKDTGFMDLPDE